MDSSDVECAVCGKMLLKRNILVHHRNVHGVSPKTMKEMKKQTKLAEKQNTGKSTLICELCGAVYTSKNGLKIHMNSKHSDDLPTLTTVPCPLCDSVFATHRHLSEHCAKNHSDDDSTGRPQDFTFHKEIFENYNLYKEWYDKMCDLHATSFFCRASKKDSAVSYMRCHRSGEGVPQGEVRAKTSKKRHRYCSAYLNVYVRKDGSVLAEGCFGHIGHEIDEALLNWTEEQIEYLKLMLQEYTTDFIIRKMRKDHSAKTSKLYFVTKKDLWNISTRYNLTPGVRAKEDMASVAMRELERNPDDGIRFLRMPSARSGKGFALVIITPLQVRWLQQYGNKGVSLDDTHNLTKYTLRLATLMVVDDRDRGLPAAFLLSAEMTWREVKILFEEIKRLVPQFEPKSLTSDEALSFYKGYKAIFPNSATELYFCRFHILQSWKRKAKECVKVELQKPVLAAFRQLLRLSDEAAFNNRLTEVLTYLRNKECLQMVQYLQKEYLGQEKIRKWASFNRKGAVMSTSMFGERWHLRLKQEKLKRKANARADFVIDVLIKAVNELAEDYEVADRRQLSSSFRVRENNIQHRLAVNVYKDKKDAIRRLDSTVWNVYGKTISVVHRVEIEASCTCVVEKNIHCSRCHVCPYAVTCTCSSGAVAGVACMHAHAIRLYDPTFQRHLETTPRSAVDQPQLIIEEDINAHRECARDLSPGIGGELCKIRDQIAQDYVIIHAKVNALVKQENADALESLRKIAENMKLAASVPVQLPRSAAVLLPRPELASVGGAPKMPKTEIYTRAKLRRKSRRSQSVEHLTVDKENILFCSLCFEEHPRLPPNTDPEDLIAKETAWMRCTNCKAWVHALCGQVVVKLLCRGCKKGHYTLNVYDE